MKILLLSAYDASSHRMWREGLVRHLSAHEWTVLTLPPRMFAWRSRGNALSWAYGSREILLAGYDRIIATSMTNLAELRGLVPELAGIPTVAYFHENQFAYPERLARKEGQNYKLTNLFTALAADRVVFNSAFNHDTMIEGAVRLLKGFPDCVPPGIVEDLASRSAILPVPLPGHCFVEHRRPARSVPLTLVWNHRWEHDKAPERFFAVLFRLADLEAPFRVHVVGQRFRDCPPIFDEARDRLGDHIATWGFAKDGDDYRRILQTSDVVVSTVLHDFQGLAVLEAVAAGCIPMVPERLAYAEFFPELFRYPSMPDNVEKEIDELARRLHMMCLDPLAVREIAPPSLEWLSWRTMAGKYEDLLTGVNASRRDKI